MARRTTTNETKTEHVTVRSNALDGHEWRINAEFENGKRLELVSDVEDLAFLAREVMSDDDAEHILHCALSGFGFEPDELLSLMEGTRWDTHGRIEDVADWTEVFE